MLRFRRTVFKLLQVICLFNFISVLFIHENATVSQSRGVKDEITFTIEIGAQESYANENSELRHNVSRSGQVPNIVINHDICMHRFESNFNNLKCDHVFYKRWFEGVNNDTISNKESCIKRGKWFRNECNADEVFSYFGPETEQPGNDEVKPKCMLRLHDCPEEAEKVASGFFEVDLHEKYWHYPAHQCHLSHMHWQQRCGGQNTVEKTYIGPGAMSEIKSDGSWNIIDIDSKLLNFKPLDLKPNQSCFEVTTYLKANIYLSGDTTFQFCYPLFNIVGYPKCGTSMAYHILTGHPKVIKAASTKEYCHHIPTKRRTFFRYFHRFGSVISASNKDVASVNGCIQPDNILAFDYMLRQPKTVHIITVRDGPTRMWSAYNFWCFPGVDSGCLRGGWTHEGHLRSPEDFHQKLLEGFNNDNIPNIRSSKHMYTNLIDQFDRVVVIASEMLKVDIKKAFMIISTSAMEQTGFSLDWYPALSEMQDLSVNTGNKRGMGRITNEATKTDGVYKISGYKPMLKKTQILLKSWWEECDMIRNMTSWHYNCSSTK